MAEFRTTVAHVEAPVERPEDALVPVRGGRRLIGWWPAWLVERNQGNFRVVRSAKGRIKRAYLRTDDPEIIRLLIAEGLRSDYGYGFQQHLDGAGVVWALKGVRGSR